MTELNDIADNQVVVEMYFGSHLYGLDTPESDIDVKGIYVPKFTELLLGTYAKSIKTSTGKQHEKNKPGDLDQEMIALPRFIEFALQGETLALDMLHCTEPLMCDAVIWESLRSNRHRFYTKNLKSFVGYVRRQAAKYGLKGTRLSDINAAKRTLHEITNRLYHESHPRKLPDLTQVKAAEIWDSLYVGQYAKRVERTTKEGKLQRFYDVAGKLFQDTLSVDELANKLMAMDAQYGARARQAAANDGIDWKAISHALRAGYQARDIYIHGDFQYPLEERDFLLEVKQGKLNYKADVSPILEELCEQVEALASRSSLPKQPNRKHWERWLLDTYRSHFGLGNWGDELEANVFKAFTFGR